MDRTRKLIAFLAAVGAVSAFLPWASVGPISISGTDASDGWAVVGAFAVIRACVATGARAQPLDRARRAVCMTLGAGATLIGAYDLVSIHNAQVGYGLIVLVAAGLACTF